MPTTAAPNYLAALLTIRDPIPQNPFPVGSPKQVLWTEATEEILRFLRKQRMEGLAALDTDGAALAELNATTVGITFDAWANRGLLFVFDEHDREHFVGWLAEYAADVQDAYSLIAERAGQGAVLAPVQVKLAERVLHWTEAAEVQLDERRLAAAEKAALASRSVSALIQKRRWKIIQDYRGRHSLDSSKAFARHVGMSVDSIKGIVREDTRRFSPETRAELLTVLGVTRKQWYVP